MRLPNMKKSDIIYFFEKPEEIPLKTLDQVRILIEEGSGVGTSWVKENLRDAFLIGYAEHEGGLSALQPTNILRRNTERRLKP